MSDANWWPVKLCQLRRAELLVTGSSAAGRETRSVVERLILLGTRLLICWEQLGQSRERSSRQGRGLWGGRRRSFMCRAEAGLYPMNDVELLHVKWFLIYTTFVPHSNFTSFEKKKGGGIDIYLVHWVSL